MDRFFLEFSRHVYDAPLRSLLAMPGRSSLRARLSDETWRLPEKWRSFTRLLQDSEECWRRRIELRLVQKFQIKTRSAQIGMHLHRLYTENAGEIRRDCNLDLSLQFRLGRACNSSIVRKFDCRYRSDSITDLQFAPRPA